MIFGCFGFCSCFGMFWGKDFAWISLCLFCKGKTLRYGRRCAATDSGSRCSDEIILLRNHRLDVFFFFFSDYGIINIHLKRSKEGNPSNEGNKVAIHPIRRSTRENITTSLRLKTYLGHPKRIKQIKQCGLHPPPPQKKKTTGCGAVKTRFQKVF